MATKLPKNTFPKGLTKKDFKCHGPVADTDTEFSTARLADMGCMSQEEVDSNKYYYVCMCTDPKNSWGVYVEYAREGAANPAFQFFDCGTESEARKVFIERCKDKNTSRGQWSTIGGIKIFVPKPGKDLYSVRKLAKRSHGLPDGYDLSAVGKLDVAKVASGISRVKRCPNTTKLMNDLTGGAVSYARASMVGGKVPSLSAIDEGRLLIQEAKRRLGVVGNDLNAQVADKELKNITYALYSRIPKIKPLNAPDKDWILSQDNIFLWEQDLGAFETAVTTGSVSLDNDPLAGYPLDMEWVDPGTNVGKWLYKWWPAATLNKHQNMKTMTIHNLWKVNRHGDDAVFQKEMDLMKPELAGQMIPYRPLHQDMKRVDLDSVDLQKLYWNMNVALMFHGTRSVNVPGILKTNLRLPAQLTGVIINAAMFGGGLYWADDWKKSSQYTSLPSALYTHQNRGAVNGRHAFMFVADVLLGIPHLAAQAKGYVEAPSGCHSVFGKSDHTYSKKNNKLHSNEWIVYKGGRNVLRYLVEYSA